MSDDMDIQDRIDDQTYRQIALLPRYKAAVSPFPTPNTTNTTRAKIHRVQHMKIDPPRTIAQPKRRPPAVKKENPAKIRARFAEAIAERIAGTLPPGWNPKDSDYRIKWTAVPLGWEMELVLYPPKKVPVRKCRHCRKPGHYASTCKAKTLRGCRRCGKPGHYSSTCKTVIGRHCSVCKRPGHNKKTCPLLR